MQIVQSNLRASAQPASSDPASRAPGPEPTVDGSEQVWASRIEPHDPHRTLLAMVSEGVLLIDACGRVLSCNAQFTALVGLPADIVLEHGVDEFLSVRDAAALRALVAADDTTVRQGIFALRRVDGTTIPVRIAVSTFPVGRTPVREAGAVFTDLRTTRAARERLHVMSERLDYEIERRRTLERHCEFALDRTATTCWRFDLTSGRATHVMGTARLPGATHASWSIDAAKDAFVVEDRASVVTAFDGVRLTGAMAVEGRCSGPDASIRWIRLEGQLLRGSSVDLALLVSDVTWKYEQEDRLLQLADMEAVGQMAAGAAHDLNNFLQVVGSSLELIGRRASQDASLARLSAVAQQALLRAARLSKRLSTPSDSQRMQLERVSFDRLLPAVEELFDRALPQTVTVRALHVCDVWDCTTDVGQLEAALLNLAINARDAMPDGGSLSLTVENRQVDAERASSWGVAPGDYVIVCVADTGTGMTRDVAARAFEPFFTTKAPGKGTGLGLSQVHAFAKRSNGFVTIESAPGVGTRVIIFLPRTNEAVAGDVYGLADMLASTPPS